MNKKKEEEQSKIIPKKIDINAIKERMNEDLKSLKRRYTAHELVFSDNNLKKKLLKFNTGKRDEDNKNEKEKIKQKEPKIFWQKVESGSHS